MADINGEISVFNERFRVGKEYIWEYIIGIIDTSGRSLKIVYNDTAECR
jgi:hypothetical protein